MSGDRLSQHNIDTFADRDFEPRGSRLPKSFELLDPEPRGRLLDVAAGSGVTAEILAGRGWEVSALDVSGNLVERMRARGIEDARTHDLSAGPLPYPDATFQAVLAGEIIEHLVDTAGFVAELTRVLVPGGVAVVTTPNLASLQNRVRLLLGRYPNYMEHELGGDGHVRAYTAKTLTAQLERGGLTVEALRGTFVPFVPQVLATDERLPLLARTGDWFPRLSVVLIAKARRRAV
jgi:2-polyprenyl-3-methyl-5-hydroxy-6-metoxy-1,4-benzoquinol methylase